METFTLRDNRDDEEENFVKSLERVTFEMKTFILWGGFVTAVMVC